MLNRFQTIVKEKSNDELLSMVYQFSEWDPEMLTAVETELHNRQMLPADIAIRKQELIEIEHLALSKGKEASLAGQIFGWIGVLGMLGLIFGYTYAFSKTRSKYTQEEYYVYDAHSRDNGKNIFYTSLTVLVLSILYALVRIAATT